VRNSLEQEGENMKTIRKYQVPITGRFFLALAKEDVVLSFQCQDGVPTIWVERNTAYVEVARWFRLYDSEQPIENIPEDAGLHYIGTAQEGPGFTSVWHLFEEVKK